MGSGFTDATVVDDDNEIGHADGGSLVDAQAALTLFTDGLAEAEPPGG